MREISSRAFVAISKKHRKRYQRRAWAAGSFLYGKAAAKDAISASWANGARLMKRVKPEVM